MKHLIFISLLVTTVISSCTQERSSGHENHAMSSATNNYADSVNSGIIPEDTLKGSPIRTAMNMVGGCHIHIVYGSPGVKGRIIWGGLVPTDKVWVTGAHNATSIDLSKDIYLGDKLLNKGKYAFFTIPGKEKWVVIINKNYDQHLTDKYTEKDDVLRLEVTPEMLDKPVQRLTYSVEAGDGGKGQIVVAWEKIRIKVPVEVR